MNLLAVWLLGVAALAFTHFTALSLAGGFHFDEAWAALFSHRIAIEPGFWPVAAMSPYTSAWSHYVAALFFNIFGTDLLVYRASGIALVMAGISLISLALKNLGQSLAGILFPWIIAFFSAAVINHRFAIEINTFHVFCFGVLAWGLSLQPASKLTWLSSLAILGATVFGITSHVLFLAPAFACLILGFWNGRFLQSSQQRVIAGAALILLAGFFLRIHLSIPEKDKSFALLMIASLSLFGVFFPAFSAKLIHAIRKRVEKPILFVFFLACGVSGFFLLFFSEGSWAAAFFNGGQSDLRVILWPLVALSIAVIASWKKLCVLAAQDSRWVNIYAWAALTVILTAAMATKPAPRYFEIPFLILAGFFALTLAHAPKRWAIPALAIWIIGGSLQLELNYFKPAREGNIPERSFRFLFFKDSSSDTLSKQDLVRYLATSGCRFDQIESDDIRILDPLRFLSLGDWHVHGSCRFDSQVMGKVVSKVVSKVIVERKSQVSPIPPTSIETHSFILYTKERR